MTDLFQQDFLFIHERENNQESEQHLHDNYEHFSEQLRKVYDLLKSGVRLTQLGAANEYHINSLSSRISELVVNKIDVKKEWLRDNEGKKTVISYYL